MSDKVIIYQMLPRLWGDGRLSSCDESLAAYLKSLGVDYLWLTGIPRHASGEDFVKGNPGSPYAISDWYDINSYLAANPDRRMQEFDSVLERMHAAGLKVLIDFIPNHTARNYKGKLCLYDWCDGDWTDTLKVDWSKPETPEEMLKILRFWAAKGVDGFRCDMVELVPSDALGRVVKALKREFPGLLFVAEVYGKDNYARYIQEAGFDLLYDKSGTYDILRGINGGSRQAWELSCNWQSLGTMQGNMLNFLENHDEQRIASAQFAGSADKTWAATAFQLLFNDASYMLYFGQEVGEDAAEGAEGRTSIFNWSKPRMISDLYAELHGTAPLPAAEKALLSRYRELLVLSRKEVFRSGANWDLCYCNGLTRGFDSGRHFVFARYNVDEAWLVFCNFSSSRACVGVALPEEFRNAAKITAEECLVDVPPLGYSICKCK